MRWRPGGRLALALGLALVTGITVAALILVFLQRGEIAQLRQDLAEVSARAEQTPSPGGLNTGSPTPSLEVLATPAAPDRTALQWGPYEEWDVVNRTWSGNPYDLQASVTFVHQTSGERTTTSMFFDGDDTWKFRFTGTRIGVWQYVTLSQDPELNALNGTVLVQPHPDPERNGFVTTSRSKWVWQGSERAFVPQLVMYRSVEEFHDNPSLVEADIREFLDEHGFNGVHTVVRCRWFDMTQPSCATTANATSDPNPDPRTFEALEMLITQVHDAGGMVHIWAWGDDVRGQTPSPWGLNGFADQRLQRYIAARLGPLPGWTMGYGFNLEQWVTRDQVVEWHDNMDRQLGWPHLLGGRPGGPNTGTNHGPVIPWNAGLDYASFEHHLPDYAVYLAAVAAAGSRPAMSEDRFRVRETDEAGDKDYTEAMTRRGLWLSAMAGGIGNIWGNLSGATGETSQAYLNVAWIRTYADFFADRFMVDMRPDSGLADGRALWSPSTESGVVYKEDAFSVRITINDARGPLAAVAVDALKPYAEIALDPLTRGEQTWVAPYASDWVIAIGDFAS